MKAVLVSKVAAAPKIGDIDVPEPGEGQMLVKTIYTAVNPVYGAYALPRLVHLPVSLHIPVIYSPLKPLL